MPQSEAAELGRFLRTLRTDAGLTQEQVAEMLDVAQPYVSQVERGIYSPSWRYLIGFANAVKTSIIDLLRRAGLLDDIPEEMEREIAELIKEVPDLAELFAAAREINREHPERLRELVGYAKWLSERS